MTMKLTASSALLVWKLTNECLSSLLLFDWNIGTFKMNEEFLGATSYDSLDHFYVFIGYQFEELKVKTGSHRN